MRIDFKKHKIQRSKFFKFCEQNGADYFEDESGVWIIPKKYGSYLMAIKLDEDGQISFGKIEDESCMNFDQSTCDFVSIEEQDWIIKTLTLFKKYKP